MCSYCGCEAEPAIQKLMDEHAVIGDLVYRVRAALEAGDADEAERLTDRLADEFERHTLGEEAGLFARMREAGEALNELDGLLEDHRRLRPALRERGLTADADRLRVTLRAVTRHAEIEDNDLFPYALQLMPDEQWAALAD